MPLLPGKRRKPRDIPRRFNVSGFLGGALCVIVGAITPFSFHFVGDLFFSEIFLPLVLPFLLVVKGREMFRSTMRPILLLMGLWLAGQILTDIFRQTAMENWLRGDANIIFFGIDLLALVALMSKNDNRKILFVVAYAISRLVEARFSPSVEEGRFPWKFGYAPGLVLLTLLAGCYFYKRRNYPLMILVFLAFSAVNVVMNYRSMVLFMLLVIAMTVPIVPERVGRLQLLPRGPTARLFVTAALALAAGGAALGVVELATKSGILGAEQQEKNEKQAQSLGGILLGGRPEILVSSRAILDSPIIGHGSWPKEPRYTEMLTDIEARYGIHVDLESGDESRAGVIPSHSSLFGSWVAAGIAGAIFWFYLLPQVVKALVKVTSLRFTLAPLYAYLLVNLFWDIFFSPFNGNHRILAAFDLVIMIDTLEARLPALAAKVSGHIGRFARRPLVWRPSLPADANRF
jgi:hypothetical protein